MIIDNPDVFKTWLTSILEPLCDADPAALAKYVYALVKKDKSVEELREGMLDQLDVFLQHETKPFVDMLFKSLDSKEYLREDAAPAHAEPGAEEPVEDLPEAPANGTSEPSLEPPAPPAEPPAAPAAPARLPMRNRVVLPRSNVRHEQTLVTKVLPLTELLEEPLDSPPKRRDRRTDSLRDKEERRRRGRSWERRGRPRRRASPRPDGPRAENRSRSPSPRGRYRNRSPPPAERPLTRSRSRSPLALRKRPHERERLRLPRELERDRMSRDRDHRERASQSRDHTRSRSGSPRDEERLSPPGRFKRRCRDFDEKGYCMRGDLCQWDHGADPLVLEDSALTRVLALPPAVPEYNPLAPDIWGAAPPPFPPYGPPPPPRELVHIPRLRDGPPPAAPRAAPPARPPPPPKKPFDFNRLGPQRPAMSHHHSSQPGGNCSLEVRKVPRGLNDITHLNNHFGKFGKIVNIQVCYAGDPEAALVTFSSHAEANVAYKSTEAVLNNRFIKVFWYNHESKQENTPPAAAPRPAAQHPASTNKVLINKDTRVANANAINANNTNANNANNANVEKPALKPEVTNGQEPKKAPIKQVDRSRQVLEMQKRAQTLLETQLRQQTLLIAKLETGNIQGPQRAALVEAIKSAQEGSEKLRTELVAYNELIKQIKEHQARRPKTREEAQKELLDAELDLFTKQQEGQDVSELAARVAELRRQAALPAHAARRPHGRGARFNTATRLVRHHPAPGAPGAPAPAPAPPGPRPAPPFSHQSVDRRPRALLLSGFEADEAEGLTQHLQKFGEVTGQELNLAVPELTVQFRSRAQAELALARTRHYNERTLSITWVPNNRPIAPVAAPPPAPPAAPPTAAPAAAAPPPQIDHSPKMAQPADVDAAEPMQQSREDALLRFDDEDEEEEDRSWRR